MAVIRQRVWVLKARPLVKKVLRNCVVCRRFKGTIQFQRMADLPVDRAKPQDAPLTYTGVDVFGTEVDDRLQRQATRYGCLFTFMQQDLLLR